MLHRTVAPNRSTLVSGSLLLEALSAATHDADAGASSANDAGAAGTVPLGVDGDAAGEEGSALCPRWRR